MRTGLRRALRILAIAAIALHTALWGLAPARANTSTIDPLSVICHSSVEAQTTPESAPATQDSAPSHACEHCNVCGALASSALPPAFALIRLLPAWLVRVPAPRPVVAANGFEISSKGARGPPIVA
jgi:hypothetical protein